MDAQPVVVGQGNLFVQVQRLLWLQQWLTSHPSKLQAGAPLQQLTAVLRTRPWMRPPSGCLWMALRW